MHTFNSKIAIIESQIFGPIGSFCRFLDVEEIRLEAHENYQKRSYRSRYQILTTNGPLSLSVPLVKGKNQQMPIQDVEISYDEDWPRAHIHTIKSSYGKSPYFEFYFHHIEAILTKRYEKLFELNQASLSLMLKLIKLSKKINHTETFEIHYDDLKYLDLRQKSSSNLDFHPYLQVWDHKFGFQKNMSILDLLFCKGPESISVLKETLDLNLSHNNKILEQI